MVDKRAAASIYKNISARFTSPYDYYMILSTANDGDKRIDFSLNTHVFVSQAFFIGNQFNQQILMLSNSFIPVIRCTLFILKLKKILIQTFYELARWWASGHQICLMFQVFTARLPTLRERNWCASSRRTHRIYSTASTPINPSQILK